MKEKISNILNKYKQTHLLSFYDDLNGTEKNKLLKQISNIDFEEMKKLYINSFHDEKVDMSKIEPLLYYDANKLTNEEKEYYTKVGIESIKKREVAVVTLAGGSGSRLGHNGPKGTYILDIKGEPKSLFELFADKLKEIKINYKVTIPWYIMTSKKNDYQTKLFFKKHHYFNYPKSKIYFFKQDSLPIMNKEGQIILENKFTILEESNGNGNVFKALKDSKCLMQMKNIKWIFFHGIDNILLKTVDPLFLGLTISKKYVLSSKSIFKEDAHSKQYVFCRKNKKPYMLDYQYITDEISNIKNDKDQYLYRDINIVCHLMSHETLQKFSELELPYHRAFKTNNYIDVKGNIVVADQPNSFKFEQFIFDVFYNEKDMLIYRVDKKEFAPIKNKEGTQSPKEAVELFNKYNK